MNKNIIHYLPPFLREVQEFKKICNVEDIELNTIQQKLDSILNETIIADASEYGIERYEEIFNIINKSAELYERRFIIQSIFLNRIPFTLEWLKNKLYQTVGDSYLIEMDYNTYSLVIRISYLFENASRLLEEDIRKSIPANIDCTIYLNENENLNLNIGGATISGCYEELWEV
ncbi:MAG: DUF2313 domain-containing protein [Clostridia bacterium]|nr:DUF2313 domain-containing protein [Clostridia bacterium]